MLNARRGNQRKLVVTPTKSLLLQAMPESDYNGLLANLSFNIQLEKRAVFLICQIFVVINDSLRLVVLKRASWGVRP